MFRIAVPAAARGSPCRSSIGHTTPVVLMLARTVVIGEEPCSAPFQACVAVEPGAPGRTV